MFPHPYTTPFLRLTCWPALTLSDTLRLSPDRLGEFCDMVRYIRDIYGKYEELALLRAAEIREKLGL
jgi:hypothetical protein